MGNKSKNRRGRKPAAKKAPVKKNTTAKAVPAKKNAAAKAAPAKKAAPAARGISALAKKSLVQSNVKLTALVLIVTYFMLDYMMMESAESIHKVLVVIFTMVAPSMMYSYYVFDYQRELYPTGGTDVPKFVKNKKKFVTIGWLMISLWGILLLVVEPLIVPRFFPLLDSTYHYSQLMLMLFVAPVMEEILFRYLLYDRWLKRKWGWFWGFIAASFIFVICHPVTDVRALVIYWVPTLLFFLIYQEFGLYGSIVIHMLYNMMAI